MKAFKQFSKSLGKWVFSWWKLLFPQPCVICGDILTAEESFLCSGCLRKAPLEEGEEDELLKELQADAGIENVYCLFHYDNDSDFHRWVHAIKYGGNKKLAVWSGKMLGGRIRRRGCSVERIIPMPLHPKREKKRGFNQAFVIGSGIAEVLNLDLRNEIVTRVMNTPSQTGLSREERMDNVKYAFKLVEGDGLCDLHVLLVDDVITTGATIRACVKELKKIPGLRVSVACLGKSGKM